MDERAHPSNMTILVRRLVNALRGRGLSAEPFGAAMVWLADPEPGDARRAILCRADDDGRLGWWWLWNGRTGGLAREWLCAADEIGAAADEIARVLAEADERPER
jgi:hypothetical protein